MNAVQKIRKALKDIYPAGDVNAMTVYKGWAIDTNLSGWHMRHFNSNQHTYLGNSVAEAIETVDDIKSSREHTLPT